MSRSLPHGRAIMMGAAFLTAFGLFVWAALLSPSSGYYQYQGRYLFPAVIPFAFLLVGGWLKLYRRGDRIVLFAGVLFLAVFDAWSVDRVYHTLFLLSLGGRSMRKKSFHGHRRSWRHSCWCWRL